MRQITAFILLLAFMASTFSKAVIVVDFYANQDYIAKYICEYRNKPIIDCGGSCYLRKQLAREDNQDKTNPERRAENRQEVLFCEEGPAIKPVIFSFTDVPYPIYTAAVPVTRAGDIFHPPA